MKLQILKLLFSSILLLSISCKNNNEDENQNSSTPNQENTEIEYEDSRDEGYKNGTYCAEVEYYNPSTGTRNTYNLDVDVERGKLSVIHWPNSGWLDKSHFYPEDITDGECEFTSDKGYRFTVRLNQFGGCDYTDGHRIRHDVNADVEATTCPECGDEKGSYDDYCDDCQDRIEHTCKRCGQVDDFMFITDKYCNDCEDKLENTCSRCGGRESNVNGGVCSSCKNKENDNY